MAIATERNTASQFVTLVHSEELYNELASIAYKKGYLDLTDTQKSELDFFEKYNFSALKKNSTYNVLSNRNENKLKAQLFTVGLPKSPIVESNRASRNVMEMVYTYDIMNYLAAKKYELENGKVHVSMLTLTFENADKTQLSDSIQEHRLFYRQLKDFFRKTLDWGDNVFLGTFVSPEVTINEAHLEKKNPKSLWHAHLHILIFTTKELKVKSVRGKIWNKYSSLCKKAGIYASERGFLLENSYVKAEGQKGYEKYFDGQKNSKRESEIARSAMMEAGKYATKPSVINSFAKKVDGEFDDFKLQCFAEYYMAFSKPSISAKCIYANKVQLEKRLTQKVRFDGSGIYKTARQVFNALKNAGLDGIFLFQKADGDMSKVPNFFTEHLEILFQNYVENVNSKSGYTYYAKITQKDTLSFAEMIYYNRDFLAGTLFPSKKILEALIKKHKPVKMSKKQKVIFDVLVNFASLRTSKTEIIEVFNDWIKTIQECTLDKDNNYDELRVADLRNVRDAYSQATFADSKYFSDVRIFKNYEIAKHIKSVIKEEKIEPFISSDSPLVFKNDKYKDFKVYSYERNGKFGCSTQINTITQADIANFRKYQKLMKDDFCITLETKNLVPVIFLYAKLRGYDLRLAQSDYDLGAGIWEYWTSGNAVNARLCAKELGFIVDCLDYALNPSDELEEKILRFHNKEIAINLTIDYDHLDKIVQNLYRDNASTQNPAFKQFEIATNEFLKNIQNAKDEKVITKPEEIESLIEGRLAV